MIFDSPNIFWPWNSKWNSILHVLSCIVLYMYLYQIEGVEFIYDSHKIFFPPCTSIFQPIVDRFNAWYLPRLSISFSFFESQSGDRPTQKSADTMQLFKQNTTRTTKYRSNRGEAKLLILIPVIYDCHRRSERFDTKHQDGVSSGNYEARHPEGRERWSSLLSGDTVENVYRSREPISTENCFIHDFLRSFLNYLFFHF